jgi:hypothetical protein
MTSVRAKFKVTSITASHYITYGAKKDDGTHEMEPVEMRTVKMSPVCGNGDPAHENTTFWQASPSGTIELGTVNRAAWEHFELSKEYYIDFTPAE